MRFAVLGTGFWADAVHAAAIHQHPKTELKAIWGRDQAKANAVAERYGARGFDDLDAALESVDAVAVALPPDVQAAVAVRAVRAGCHVLLEKPLALTTAAADDVLAAVDGTDVAALVFFTNRFVPMMVDFLDRVIEAHPDGATVTMLGSILGDANPYRESAWRHEYGGLWDLGPHALSLLVPALGPVTQVTAAPATHGTTHVIATHASGATSTMALSVLSPRPRQAIEFSGAGGEIVAPAVAINPVAAFQTAIDDLIGLVATGRRDHPCDVRFARHVTATLAASQVARDSGVRTAVY
jgi:predicted dehydrogenase